MAQKIMSEVRVYDALQQMYLAEYDFSITVEGTEMYTAPDVYAELCRYATFSYIDVSATITRFIDRWEAWIRQQGGDLLRAWQALRTEYNPINNYDMSETSADGTKRDADHDTVTPYGSTTMTTRNTRPGVDSTGDGVTVGTSTSEQTYQQYYVDTDRTHDNTLADATLGSSYNDLKHHTLQRSGNIGVTTSQQMITAELDLRKQDLLADFVARFIEKWCSLVHGGEYT